MKLLLIISLMGLIGCGSDNDNGAAEIKTVGNYTLYLTDESELPECNDLNQNQLVYLESKSSFVACKATLWIDVAIKAEKGEQGEIGETGDVGKAGLSVVSSKLIGFGNANYCTEYAAIEQCYFNGGQITIFSDGYIEMTGSYSYELFISTAIDNEAEWDKYGSNGHVMIPPNRVSGFIRLDWNVSRNSTTNRDLFLVYEKESNTAKIMFDTNDNNKPDDADEVVETLSLTDL